jgi:hypothetical protein
MSFEPLLMKMKIRDKLMLKRHSNSQKKAVRPHHYSFPESELHQNDAALITFLWL